MLKKCLKGLAILCLTCIAIFLVFLGVVTLLNPKSPTELVLDVHQNTSNTMGIDDTFTITTFNIGYASLDHKQDFFFDGGTQSRGESKAVVEGNLDAIVAFLKETDSDFYLIQEVDEKARRSYYIDQKNYLVTHLDGYGSFLAYNYNAVWVPVPLLDPLGDVDAGMMTFSKYHISHARRLLLKGQESWPMNTMELDRCITEARIPLDNGKSLYVINLHLSAYDKGGLLRNEQAEHLVERMNALYEEGHYVVLGGDFNQLLCNRQLDDPAFMEKWPEWLVMAPESLSETGYLWAIDSEVNTVRDLATPYVPGETFETIIDGFLYSPNLELVHVKTHDLGFIHSDHNPVTAILRFIK